jgi:predicted CXXCH cytochrome family protein
MARVFLFVAVMLFVLAPIPASVVTEAEAEGCTTSECHSSLLEARTVHPATEECESCHESADDTHPVKRKKTFTLADEVPALCFMCHDPAEKRVIHPPVEEGECTTCHDPHASDETAMLVQPSAELCLMCHPEQVEHAYLHGPASAGECILCHSPHESDYGSLVLRDGPELCLTCHFNMEEEMKKRYVHSALEEGCTSCHNPHGSPFPKMFPVEGEDLCFQCHDEIGELVGNAQVVHGPIMSEKSCASCHSPHASDGEKLMEKSGKDLCLGCHPEVLKKTYKTLHGPIEDGTCTACHNPHGSSYDSLLNKEFSGDFYVPYTEESYGLCFSCHERDMLRFPDTSFATGFRDGKRNLHFLHVNRKKSGRNCIACHSVHGSEHEKLIKERVTFGKWKFSLNFEKTETGGSCSPGCHQPYSYDRNTGLLGGMGTQPVKEK